MVSFSKKQQKILFVAMSMNIGGAEKSLVNLLNLLDYDKYSVDLILFQRTGGFLPQIPNGVNLIDVPEIDVLYGIDPEEKIAFPKRISCLVNRYVGTLVSRVREKQFYPMRLIRWRNWYHKCIPALNRNYDVAIAYSGGETFYYIAEKVTARKKINYFHNDYSNIVIDLPGERKYLCFADQIVTISDTCLESLKILFPEYSEKMRVVQNPSSPSLLKNMAQSGSAPEFLQTEGITKIVSIGRLHPTKGFDIAVDAAALLRQRGLSFKWIVIGDGPEREKIQRKIAKLDLGGTFVLVGPKINPYPYLATADFLVQSSLYEGKSVVLDEAKILGKPVVVTNYPSAKDQIENGVTGLISEIDAKSLADTIRTLVENDRLLEDIRYHVANADVSVLSDISTFEEQLVLAKAEA